MEKLAVVTGASSGIGFAIAEELSHDHHVVGICRTPPPQYCEWVEMDLSKPPHHFNFPWDRPIDILVNNAGAMRFDELGYEDALELFQLNTLAPWWLSRRLEPWMEDNSNIINIASVSGMNACTEALVYSMTKAAIIALTKSLALKLAPNVRVNCISPGFIKTNLVPGDVPQELIDTIPLGHVAQPRVIAHTVRWLIENPYTTGSNIVVDGGVSIHDN